MRSLLSLLVLGSVFLAGCLPESKHPLSTPATSRRDSRLEGVFAQRNDPKSHEDASYWHFHYRGARVGDRTRTTSTLEILSVEAAKDGGLKTHRYEALTTRLAGHDYFSFIDLSEHGTQKALPYGLARYEVSWRGELRVWIASDAAFAAAIKTGKLRGIVIPGKFGETVKITESTEGLAAFVAASDPQVLFTGKPLTMRRVVP